MKAYAQQYKMELLHQIIPFWETYSLDGEHGGYFTCLLPEGKVFDTDKFVWLQARQAWMFSRLYQRIAPEEKWLAAAKLGIDFLEKYGRDAQGHWYFSLTREGKPLVQPYNIFSDCFAAMAFGAFHEVTGEAHYADIALQTYRNILARQQHPKGIYEKGYPGTRTLQNFALPMILCNLSLELEPLLGAEVDTIADKIVPLLMERFYQEDTGLVLENIGLNGHTVDSFEGRLLNPGHAIEAMWFIMNLGMRKKDAGLVAKAEKIMYQQLSHGWDHVHGGIFYFLDAKGYPLQQLEWDQKLWWVHLETLVALAKTYAWNNSSEAAAWFHKVHGYAWAHFRDAEHGGEWFGYLNRRGEVLLPLKGGKWKGCFHVPRALLEIWRTLETLS